MRGEVEEFPPPIKKIIGHKSNRMAADIREWTDYKNSPPIWKRVGEKLVNSVEALFFGSRRVIPSQACV